MKNYNKKLSDTIKQQALKIFEGEIIQDLEEAPFKEEIDFRDVLATLSISSNQEKKHIYIEANPGSPLTVPASDFEDFDEMVQNDQIISIVIDYNDLKALKINAAVIDKVSKREIEEDSLLFLVERSNINLFGFLCTLGLSYSLVFTNKTEKYEGLESFLRDFEECASGKEYYTYSKEEAVAATQDFLPEFAANMDIKSVLPINMAFLDNGFYNVTGKIAGMDPVIFPNSENSSSISEIGTSYEQLKEKFNCFKDRVFTDEEKAMMEANKVDEFYEPSENVIIMAKKFSESRKRPSHLRKNNILLEGPTGTGKTKDSQVFADLIGLPYTKITCFADMDSSDVAGAIYPVLDEDSGTSEKKDKVPSELEIELDPQGAYERFIGKKAPDGITPDEVRKSVEKKLADFYSTDEGQNSPQYVYYASEIVKAFENGWVLEIQEPTCIADAAVLMILNSALEKDGIINLPDRTVRRHPDFICIMTTNRNYNGCRPLNQALRNRFNLTRKVELPGTNDLARRVITATGCTDEKFVRKAVEAVLELNHKCDQIGLNASVSTRNLLDFVADAMDGYPIRESVHEDLLWNITTDDDDAAELESFLENNTQIFETECKSEKAW